MFGVTSNMNQKETNYTSFKGAGSNSFMFSSGARLSLGGFEKEMEITNYENALAWGKIGLSLYDPGSYQKYSKTPNIYYEPTRPKPVVLNEGNIPDDKAQLPLVNHPGSLASKRRWDDKGAFKIQKQKSPRFAADSYLGEKPFIKEQPLPKDVPDGNHKFFRAPSHVFPGLKKPLQQKYIDDKKTLIKSII